jgi:hypothetical protein
MTDAFFGEAKGDEQERALKVKWPLRPLNLIEAELNGAMCEAMTLEEYRAPLVFVEDSQFANEEEWTKLYGPMSAHEAIAMREIVFGEVQERYRRQLIVARELGEKATLELYLIACEVEGIDPILKRKTP